MLDTHYNRIEKTKKTYIIPNLITYSNMALGLMAILISSSKDINSLKLSSLLIIFAALTDKLDGYVARKFDMTSELGKQLDSLCDSISFGLAPTIIAWNLGIEQTGLVLGLMSIIIFVGAGIFRLARFNLAEESEYIEGLPITIAGLIMAIKYIIDLSFRVGKIDISIISIENIILISILSILMISNYRIKKPSFLK